VRPSGEVCDRRELSSGSGGIYTSPRDCEVRLYIYNVLGKRVEVLVNERKRAGYYYAIWNGKDGGGKQVVSGVYFSTMEAGDFRSTKKMVLLR